VASDLSPLAPSRVDRVSRGEAFGLLAFGNALWAGTYAAGKIALAQLSFIELNALRFTLATLVLAPVLWTGRSIAARELSDRRSLRELSRLVILGFVLNKAFEYAGLSLSTAVDVALLIATVVLLGESLAWATMLGALLILSSLMIVTFGASSREAELLVAEPPQ
jgi:drug/metabolite transporter (DMT)-like permease